VSHGKDLIDFVWQNCAFVALAKALDLNLLILAIVATEEGRPKVSHCAECG